MANRRRAVKPGDIFFLRASKNLRVAWIISTDETRMNRWFITEPGQTAVFLGQEQWVRIALATDKKAYLCAGSWGVAWVLASDLEKA